MARVRSVSRVFRKAVNKLKRFSREDANQININDSERESRRQARELKKSFLQDEKRALAIEKKAQFKEGMALAIQAYKQRCMERKMLREEIINEELR